MDDEGERAVEQGGVLPAGRITRRQGRHIRPSGTGPAMSALGTAQGRTWIHVLQHADRGEALPRAAQGVPASGGEAAAGVGRGAEFGTRDAAAGGDVGGTAARAL